MSKKKALTYKVNAYSNKLTLHFVSYHCYVKGNVGTSIPDIANITRTT